MIRHRRIFQRTPLSGVGSPTVLLGPGFVNPGITYTADTNLTYFDSTGTLQTAGVNTMVLDYDPSTLALRGYPFWEARTNSIRNNTMQGASAGTPGTMPTNWTTFTALTGLTRTVVGTGTESGVNYIDIQLSGTPSSAGTYFINYETTTQIAASNGQTWSGGAFYKLAAGALTGISAFDHFVAEENAGGSQLGGGSITFTPTSSGLAIQRQSVAYTNVNASTAFEGAFVRLTLTGVAINITLRIGLPQLELGAFATPVIKTTNAAVTRAAPSCAITGSAFSGFWNIAQGSLLVSIIKASTDLSKIIAIDNGSAGLTTNGIDIDIATTTQVRTLGFAASAAQWSIAPATSFSAGIIQKYAVGFATDSIGFSPNGAAASTDASAIIPSSGITQMTIGNWAGGSFLNGWINSLLYYPVRLPNASLQSLST